MESSRSRFDPAVAEPRAWNAGIGMGHAIGVFSIPYMITTHTARHDQLVMGLQSYASFIAMAVFLLLAPAIVSRLARRKCMAWGALPLAVGSIWLLAERLVRMTYDPSAHFSLSDSLVYASILLVVWLFSTSPVVLYRYWMAYSHRTHHHNNTKFH
ncbi:MAG TPA: hypothetical protein VGK19_07800 [Capsulimonadaceae bacterium]|jgi:hypothetical protein